MTIKELKKHALASLKNQWGNAICIILLVIVFTSFITPIIEIVSFGSVTDWLEYQFDPYGEVELPLVAVLLEFIVYIVLIPFTVGVYWFFLSISRGTKPEIKEVFSPYKNFFWKTIALTIVQAIFIFLWSFLFLIPGIIKTISYSQSYYILKDNPDMGILDIITESRKRMNGYKWKYFLMLLSFIGWAILSIITLGIGFLFLYPYVYATLAAFYHLLIADNSVDSDGNGIVNTNPVEV